MPGTSGATQDSTWSYILGGICSAGNSQISTPSQLRELGQLTSLPEPVSLLGSEGNNKGNNSHDYLAE